MRLLGVVAVVGCAPESRYERTSVVCGFAPTALGAEALLVAPVYPSEACVDQVLADFGATDLGEHADAYALVDGSPASTEVDALLWAAHALLSTDLGDVGSPTGWWAERPAFAGKLGELADRWGHPHVAPLLYDYVTERVRRTEVGADPDAHAGMLRRTLYLYDLPAGIDGAAVLVHEARHAEGHAFDHVLCDGEPVCDADTDGPIAFQMAVHERARDLAGDELVAKVEQAWLDALDPQILSGG